MPFTIIDGDSFTSTGAGVKINVPGNADYFVTNNLTQAATTQATGRVVKAEWWKDQTAKGNALVTGKEDTANILNQSLITSGGFTFVQSLPDPESEIPGTVITKANPAVATTSTQGYSNGDRVRIYGNVAMKQIGGMDFTVSSVTSTSITLLGLDASGFSGAETGFKVRRISDDPAVSPEAMFVTGISTDPQAVVSVSIAHNYQVGQLIHFSVPASFGMSEIDQLSAEIVSVSTYSMTVDLDSQGFSAFAFPASSGSPTTRLFATVGSAGQRNSYNVDEVPFKSGEFLPYMFLAGGAQSPAGSASDIVEWAAYKFER